MAEYHVLRSYTRKSDGQLAAFGRHVATCLAENVFYTATPIEPAILAVQASKLSTAEMGDTSPPLQNNDQRNVLIDTLDVLADYVEITADNNPAKILSSGFELTNCQRTQALPGMTSITAVRNVASGKLGLALVPADNACAYIVEYVSLTNGFLKIAPYTNSQDVVLTGLTPGTIYSLRVQVMGCNNQTTEWCVPVQHMAT